MAKQSSTTAKSTKKASATPSSPAPAAAPTAAPRSAAAAPVFKPRPTHDEIARRAYEVWVRKGRPVGRDLENWNDAERELGLRK
ncbi:MAG: DUF2934 domain-containing protein [Planctomycetes bacterium]|nr:DUF2934 domain-containing protein [Planctomycetota bacterium]